MDRLPVVSLASLSPHPLDVYSTSRNTPWCRSDPPWSWAFNWGRSHVSQFIIMSFASRISLRGAVKFQPRMSSWILRVPKKNIIRTWCGRANKWRRSYSVDILYIYSINGTANCQGSTGKAWNGEQRFKSWNIIVWSVCASRPRLAGHYMNINGLPQGNRAGCVNTQERLKTYSL